MHYIRFLKTPQITTAGSTSGKRKARPSERGLSFSAKITITTDLGEAFLGADVGLTVSVLLRDSHGNTQLALATPLKHLWQGSRGMRALTITCAIALPLPLNNTAITRGDPRDLQLQMFIRPTDPAHTIDRFARLLGAGGVGEGEAQGESAAIVPVRSQAIVIGAGAVTSTPGLVERVFHASNGAEVHIWEETGESIARHIWDAGLILSAVIAECLLPFGTATATATATTAPHLPKLQRKLRKANHILELGAGCGIVSLTLHTLLSTYLPNPNLPTILLTDLPAATSILALNTALHRPPPRHVELDWSQPLPADVAATPWQLVFVADCTYNPDVVPNLVRTLNRLREHMQTRPDENENENKDEDIDKMLVVVALKERHISERIFFDLMARTSWVIKEECTFQLPTAREEVRVLVFGFGARYIE